MSERPEVQHYDFGLIGERFDALRAAMGNSLEREWPKGGKYGAVQGGRALVLGLYRIAENHVGASRFLMADKPPNPARKLEYALAASPHARVILDALCTVVFLFHDFRTNVDRHYRAGFRELVEETRRLRDTYGTDPDWNEHLEERDKMIQEGRPIFGVSATEEADLKKIKRFPIPDHMLRELPEKSDHHAFIRYLIDWFYRTLSQDAHLSWSGIARSAMLLFPHDLSAAERTHRLELLRTRQVNMTLTLMMALITELELEFRFGLNEKAKYVWAILSEWSTEAKELYQHHYARILGPATVKLL